MKSIELLAFDKHQNLQFEGKCKIRIDRLSSLLLIEPINEDYKMISAMFKWKYVIAKNILFVFGEHESNDFALVFDEEIRCRKVYDFIFKNEVKTDIEKEILYKRFWIPLCNKIFRKDDSCIDLKKIVKQWIDSCDGEEKEEYINLLKDNNIYDIVFSSMGPSKNIPSKKKNLNAFGFENVSNCRKRRHHEMVKMYDESDMSDEYDQQLPGCGSRRKQVTAKLFQNDDGENYVILSKSKHICDLKLYTEAINVIQQIILYLPDFELTENIKNGKKQLLIFHSKNRSLCYKYTSSGYKNIYQCSGCHYVLSKTDRDYTKTSRAKLCKNKNGECVVQLNHSAHVCKPKKYENKKIIRSYDYFLIQSKNTSKPVNIALYHPEDKKLCYIFVPSRYSELSFKCQKCAGKGKTVTIRVEKDDEGREFFWHDYQKHICEPIKVSSIYDTKVKKIDFFKEKEMPKIDEVDEKNILKHPDFELRPNIKGIANAVLYILHKENRNLGYKYWYVNNKYCCGKRPQFA